MHPALTQLPAIGRILLSLIFVLAGFRQLGNIGGMVDTMSRHGFPDANILAWGAIALEIGGGLMLVVGLLARPIAAAFFCYTLALAVIFHGFWTMSGAAAHEQQSVFLSHLAIMGGMLFIVAFGAGPYSIDALIWRPHRAALAAAAS